MDALTGSVIKAASSIDIKGIAGQAEGLVKGATGGTGKGITDGIKGLFGK